MQSSSAAADAVASGSCGPASAAPSHQPPTPGSPHRFSADAAPFVPSYAVTPVMLASTAPADSAPPLVMSDPLRNSSSGGGGDGDEEEVRDEDSDRSRFARMWMHCLHQMQGHEVGMLIDMMPPDIQDLYSDRLSDEYLLHDHEHKDKSVHALRAAQNMVRELTPEQLVCIEEFLLETDALNPAAPQSQRRAAQPQRTSDGVDEPGERGDMNGIDEDDLFVNDDDGMGSEEEEWLLEQVMAASGGADAAAASAAK
ncbi:hypothetical protein NESM_000190200 [Novymonas esmeraldas]|uniref:Uncharacterized protein n=1 Tax=Novymonas esmeraldas TaxID=1808958 RepID=A0AAW0F809_9TRYP